MTQSPNPFETTQGYAQPTAVQFGVFLDNRVGKLRDVVEAFAETPGLRMCAMSVHEAADHAVVRLVSNDAHQTRRLAKQRGWACAERDVLLVQLSQTRTLRHMCYYIVSAELSIDFVYPMLYPPTHDPVLVVAVDDPTLSAQILCKKHFQLYGEADLSGS